MTWPSLPTRAKPASSNAFLVENAKIDLKEYGDDIEYQEDPYKAAKGAHAIEIITEWDLYKTLDYEKLYRNMQKPAFIFDGRNILYHEKLFKIGFEVHSIGKPALVHFTED